MNAHLLNDAGVIINTIVVDSLDVFPNLVDAEIGGVIGDSVINGVLIPKAEPEKTKTQYQNEIDEIERSTLENRGSREFAMAAIRREATFKSNDENDPAYGMTVDAICNMVPYYRKLKEIDDKIRALREAMISAPEEV